jgi:hypothetical protein
MPDVGASRKRQIQGCRIPKPFSHRGLRTEALKTTPSKLKRRTSAPVTCYMRVANAARGWQHCLAFFSSRQSARSSCSPTAEVVRRTKTLTSRIRFMPARNALISRVPPQIEKAFRALEIRVSAISSSAIWNREGSGYDVQQHCAVSDVSFIGRVRIRATAFVRATISIAQAMARFTDRSADHFAVESLLRSRDSARFEARKGENRPAGCSHNDLHAKRN